MVQSIANHREERLEDIREAGRYIVEHAENILGEYPSGLVSLDIRIVFDGTSIPTIKLEREHIVMNAIEYVKLKERHRG